MVSISDLVDVGTRYWYLQKVRLEPRRRITDADDDLAGRHEQLGHARTEREFFDFIAHRRCPHPATNCLMTSGALVSKPTTCSVSGSATSPTVTSFATMAAQMN